MFYAAPPNTEHRLPAIPVLSQSPLPAERSPSPARNPESVNIHVKNLVRPFTERQLKELLGKTGTLKDGGFWIDKIKSHCYAVVRLDGLFSDVLVNRPFQLHYEVFPFQTMCHPLENIILYWDFLLCG